MAPRVAFALSAHPDDIEFMMSGTLLMLGRAGYELHVMNLASGHCGTASEDAAAISKRRFAEARDAAQTLGAMLHDPIGEDLEIFYDLSQLRRAGAVMREVAPTILLLQPPQDYMEDHMNACRLGVTAAFARGMRNFVTEPPLAPIAGDVTVYHALPWGLRDAMRRVVKSGQYVNITPVVTQKREALACHRSQKEWLDQSQGVDSYLITMEEMSREVGTMSGSFEYAEGWRRHSHLGFCSEDADPLKADLGNDCVVSQEYEEALEQGRFL